ncbi:hypothetical protein [Vibrio splendidus]|uniref:hypothetical protein n=1 Tax=Vibrio splendidus TaxID=29497 RepID=UPI0011B824CC|nr:hypothetical protein [Vibrio splendidus]
MVSGILFKRKTVKAALPVKVVLFTNRIDDVQSAVEKGLRLYVAYICPWATRTLIARSLFNLEDFIDVKILDPVLTDFGWLFSGKPDSVADSTSTEM